MERPWSMPAHIPLQPREDAVALDAWYPLGAVEELAFGRVRTTTLLGACLGLVRKAGGEVEVWREDGGSPAPAPALPVRLRHGYVWTTLGVPAGDVFTIPEYAEPDRRNLNGGSVRVRAAAPRVVENFLDMGHLAIVHEGYLGVPPRAEIKPYKVEITADPDEVIATGCRIYQPQASLAATEGFEVEYAFRVPHPYCAVLYKSSALDLARNDVIAILVQPVDEEHSIAHMMVSVLDADSSDRAIRAFQQFIFGQDRPILENQRPVRLPLDPLAEIPVKADATASAYRRWLRRRGVRYGTLPVEAGIADD